MPRYTTAGGYPNPDPYGDEYLERLSDWFVEDILSLTDEEVLAECRADGQVPGEVAGAARQIWEAARAQLRGET